MSISPPKTPRDPVPPNSSNNIEVFIRIRPFNQSQNSQLSCLKTVNQNEIAMRQKQIGQSPSFTFDRIFGVQASQQEVYQDVSHGIIDNAFTGINGTVFCYGQTSSGKTYTSIGKDLRDQSKGILPRMIEQILDRAQSTPKNIECKLKISMIEIYNQKIKDLLDPSKSDLKIRSDKSRGIFIQHLTQKYILSQQQANNHIAKGIQNRSVAFTNMNAFSSRSHMLVMITLSQHDFYTGEARASKITIVDLAGSQKIGKTGVQGKLLQQAKKINTSLSTLGKVINILSEGKKGVHVPYRDSKLTRLLQQSLGGNSITKLIVNVSPALINQQQTITSLRFGSRAKTIKNQPHINKQFTVEQLLELLCKAERKIKLLTQVIKLLMKQKGKEDIGFKEFVKMYAKDTKFGIDGDKIDDSEDQNCNYFQLVKSMSTKFASKKQRQAKMPSLGHAKSFSGEFKFHQQRTSPEIQKNPQSQVKLKHYSPAQQSMVNLFRASDVSVKSGPQNIIKGKGKSFTKQQNRKKAKKQQIKITDLMLKLSPQQQSDKQSILLDNKSQKQQNLLQQNQFYQPDKNNHLNFTSRQPSSYHINQISRDDEHNIFAFNSIDGRSIMGSLCAINSKVLDISISGLDFMSISPGHHHDSYQQFHSQHHFDNNQSKNTDIDIDRSCMMEFSVYQSNSIQYNIQQIRNNLKRLKNFKQKKMVV